MTRRRQRRRAKQAATAKAVARHEPRLPSEFERAVAAAGLQLAIRALKERRWRGAYEFAEKSRPSDPALADAVMAEASAREAKRAALSGRFVEAQLYAKRAVELRPGRPTYQERRRLIRRATEAALRDIAEPLFADTVGPTRGHWWDYDLLARVRGWDGSKATVQAPSILGETRRGVLQDVYAVGIYQPWHVPGNEPLFTSYIKALKPGGKTIPYAGILLRQGLTEEVEWSEELDVIVPMATSLRSYELRGFELTEELAEDLGLRMCLPVVDAFEVDPYAEPTHSLGGYAARRDALAESLRLKLGRSALLDASEAVLVVDDVVTHGSTFEACAIRLRERFPHLRVYGAALAYVETPQRRERAEAEMSDPAH